MKKMLSRLVLVLLAVFMLFGVFALAPEESQAAKACKQISGDSTKITTFIVTTGSKKASIKFTQTKGKMNKSDNLTSAIKNTKVEMYEYYTIKVEKLKNNKAIKSETKTYTFKKGSSEKIPLDKNSKYKITVTPLYVSHVKAMQADPNRKINYLTINPYREGGTDNTFKNLILGVKNIISGKNGWVPRGWATPSKWTVKSASGVNACSFSK